MGILSGLLSMFGWGTADFFAAGISRKIGPILTVFWSQVFGFSLALIYFLANFSSFDIGNVLKYLVILAPFGFLHMVAFLFYYKGFVEGKISLVSPIASTYVTIVVLLSIFLLKESLRINQLLAIILIILCVFLISINIRNLRATRKLSTFCGVKDGLIAMFCWGISMFSVIFSARIIGWFIPVFLFRFLIVFFLAISMIFTKRSLKITFQPSFLAVLFVIGFLDVGAFFSYSFGTLREYASIVAPVAASFPLVTIILVRIFLKEKLALNQIFGIIGVIIGLILISI